MAVTSSSQVDDMASRIDGVALGSIAVGSIVLYAGITGKSIPAALQLVIQGKAPSQLANQYPVTQVVQNSQSTGLTAPVTPPPTTGGTGVAGGTFSHAQLMTLWTLNGGSAATANIAAAIAQAESSGRSNVTSSNPDGGINVGLWQLDTRGKGAGNSVSQLQNPDNNAKVAIMGSANGTDWSAWETFATGAYKKFLS
jgi:hypothetical protein